MKFSLKYLYSSHFEVDRDIISYLFAWNPCGPLCLPLPLTWLTWPMSCCSKWNIGRGTLFHSVCLGLPHSFSDNCIWNLPWPFLTQGEVPSSSARQSPFCGVLVMSAVWLAARTSLFLTSVCPSQFSFLLLSVSVLLVAVISNITAVCVCVCLHTYVIIRTCHLHRKHDLQRSTFAFQYSALFHQ